MSLQELQLAVDTATFYHVREDMLKMAYSRFQFDDDEELPSSMVMHIVTSYCAGITDPSSECVEHVETLVDTINEASRMHAQMAGLLVTDEQLDELAELSFGLFPMAMFTLCLHMLEVEEDWRWADFCDSVRHITLEDLLEKL
jgi:hypothetical protein